MRDEDDDESTEEDWDDDEDRRRALVRVIEGWVSRKAPSLSFLGMKNWIAEVEPLLALLQSELGDELLEALRNYARHRGMYGVEITNK